MLLFNYEFPFIAYFVNIAIIPFLVHGMWISTCTLKFDMIFLNLTWSAPYNHEYFNLAQHKLPLSFHIIFAKSLCSVTTFKGVVLAIQVLCSTPT
jgi:hypothetical protein